MWVKKGNQLSQLPQFLDSPLWLLSNDAAHFGASMAVAAYAFRVVLLVFSSSISNIFIIEQKLK